MAKLIKFIVFQLIVFLSFGFAAAFAATYYADTGGSGTTCSVGSPCTLEYAVETKAAITPPNTVSVNDGTYLVANPFEIPVGVHVTSTSQDKTLVIIQPAANYGTGDGPLVEMISGTPGTTGGQTLSYLTFDGQGTYYARQGICIRDYNNVTIHHCTIEDFTGIVTNTQSTRSWGIEVLSTEETYSYHRDNCRSYFVAPDLSKSGLYPVNPVDNFQFYSNIVDDCGYSDGVNNWSAPDMYLLHLANSSIHDNTFDHSHAENESVYATPAVWENVDFYNNITIVHSSGSMGAGGTNWCLEVWVLHDCKFYNNKMINAGMSTTLGKDCEWYYNYIDITGVGNNAWSIGIEATLHNGAKIRHNRIICNGVNTVGNPFLTIGAENDALPTGCTITNYIWGNIFHDASRYFGIEVYDEGDENHVSTTYIINNLIDSVNHYGDKSAILTREAATNTQNIILKNNIITNNDRAVYESLGAPT